MPFLLFLARHGPQSLSPICRLASTFTSLKLLIQIMFIIFLCENLNLDIFLKKRRMYHKAKYAIYMGQMICCFWKKLDSTKGYLAILLSPAPIKDHHDIPFTFLYDILCVYNIHALWHTDRMEHIIYNLKDYNF